MKVLNEKKQRVALITVLTVIGVALCVLILLNINKSTKVDAVEASKEAVTETSDKPAEVVVPEIKEEGKASAKETTAQVKTEQQPVVQPTVEQQTTSEPPQTTPVTTDNVNDPNKVPTYTEEQVKPYIEEQPVQQPTAPVQTEQQQNPPAQQQQTQAGHEGQINVPGFGWIDSCGGGVGEVVTSDGDINKMVGKMD